MDVGDIKTNPCQPCHPIDYKCIIVQDLLQHVNVCYPYFSVAEYEKINKMGTYNLAVVFGPSLVRPRPEDVV